MPTKKYKVDGRRVPGVTTVIGTSLGWGKEGLLHWAWEQGAEGKDFREERDKAADAGTIAHAMAEAEIKGLPLPTRPFELDDVGEENWDKAEKCYGAYLRWRKTTKLKLIASEVSFVSPVYRYGGTIDSVAIFEDTRELSLVDFKNSNGTYPEHLIQLAGYIELWERGAPFECEVKPERAKIAGVELLRFSKSGSFHHSSHSASDFSAPWRAFLLLRELYDLKKPIQSML